MKEKIKDIFSSDCSIRNKWNEAIVWFQSISASDLADSISAYLAEKINVNTDLYDKMIDWNYVHNHIGSSTTHHITDGAHSIWGAFQKAAEAYPNDSFFTEMLQAMEHLGRDLFSVSGVNPFLQMSPEQFASFKEIMAAKFHISKSWINDLLQINGVELMVAGISALYLIFRWNKAEQEAFMDYAGSMGAAAIYTANPLLGVVFLVALARHFTLAKRKNSLRNMLVNKSLFKGAVSTSTFFAVSTIIGGPVFIGIILAVIATIYARKIFNLSREEMKERLSELLSDILFYFNQALLKVKDEKK